MGAENGRGHGVGRGTTNRNDRGGSDDRRRRREWLVSTFRADVDGIWVVRKWSDGEAERFLAPESWAKTPSDLEWRCKLYADEDLGEDHVSTLAIVIPVCRCFRCGTLLTVDTVTVDKIIPACQGGTYRRNNIRPACARCNSVAGAVLRGGRKSA